MTMFVEVRQTPGDAVQVLLGDDSGNVPVRIAGPACPELVSVLLVRRVLDGRDRGELQLLLNRAAGVPRLFEPQT